MEKGESNMKNNWEKLARVLKLRLFEKFTIDTDRKHKFYFSMHGMAKVGSDDKPQPADEEMKMVLDGDASLILSQYVPRDKETYWYWDDSLILKDKYWENVFADKQRLMVGNCFRTDEDARNGLQELCDFVTTYYENILEDTFYKKG